MGYILGAICAMLVFHFTIFIQERFKKSVENHIRKAYLAKGLTPPCSRSIRCVRLKNLHPISNDAILRTSDYVK